MCRIHTPNLFQQDFVDEKQFCITYQQELEKSILSKQKA